MMKRKDQQPENIFGRIFFIVLIIPVEVGAWTRTPSPVSVSYPNSHNDQGQQLPYQYYYRGGFRTKNCSPTTQLQVEGFSHSPKIWVKYDSRNYNASFATLKKSSVRENMLHISCNAKYPVTLLPNPLIMVDKSLIKSFEDNMDTQCHTDLVPKSPCSNYTVGTSIPVHLLYLSVDIQCQSYCKQVGLLTQLRVVDSKGVIYGNMTSSRIPVPTSPTPTLTPPTRSPMEKHYYYPSLLNQSSANSADSSGWDSNTLVQIYVSPMGTQGKNWIIKCSTDSDLTARGATLLMKLDNTPDAFLVRETKEYRKAGIHTIRATFDLATEDVEYVHCLFPRMNDFPWISRHTSIHFHDPISYWECILRLCGAFLCSFILIGGICIVIHKWLHSDCCAKRNQLSSVTSQSQLSLRTSQRSCPSSQRSFESGWNVGVGTGSVGGNGIEFGPGAVSGSGQGSSGISRTFSVPGKRIVMMMRQDSVDESSPPPEQGTIPEEDEEEPEVNGNEEVGEKEVNFEYHGGKAKYNYCTSVGLRNVNMEMKDEIIVAQLHQGISSCHL